MSNRYAERTGGIRQRFGTATAGAAVLAGMVVSLSTMPACSNADKAPAPKNGPSDIQNNETDNTESTGSMDQSSSSAEDKDISAACTNFCEKALECEPDANETVSECTNDCEQDARGVSSSLEDRDSCLVAFVDYWNCQGSQPCEDIGMKSCIDEQAKLDQTCFADTEGQDVGELPAHRLRVACSSMCERIEDCASKGTLASDTCEQDCLPDLMGSQAKDPGACIQTTIEWANCRTKLSCEELSKNQGCESEKANIACAS